MKIKNSLRLAFGFVLAVGSLNVAMAKTNKTTVQTNAADVTTGSVLMNTNGNIRYISKSDNPDVWSSETSETLNYGRFSFNDFTNKGGISNGWGTAASDGSGTLSNTPFTYTGRASNSMTFTESVASGNCVGLYIPICFYAASVPAYSKVTFKVNIDVYISGGGSRNFVTAQFFHGGSAGEDGAKQSLPLVFYIPKNSDYLKTIGDIKLNIGQGDNAGSLSSTGTYSYYATVSNTTGTAKHMEAYYGGLFLGGRKDSSTTHKIVGTIRASSSEVTTTKYVCANTTTGKVYETLSDACLEVANGQTITLTSNVKSTNLNLNRNFTLDLNGYDIDLVASLLYVYPNYSVTIKGTGTIKSNRSGAVVSNSGTLTIPNGVSIVNNYVGATGNGISNAGTLYFLGSVSSYGEAIRTTAGAAHIKGGTISSTHSNAIYINGGQVYLSNAPTITSGSASEDIYLNINDTALHGYDSAYYSGSTLTLRLSALPKEGAVVVNKTFNNKFTIVNEPAYGYEFQYTGNRDIVYTKLAVCVVTYNANGGTGTLVDSNEYLYGASVTILANTFTRKYYTFSHWNTSPDDTGTNYLPGRVITVSANVTLYAIWMQTETDLLDYFADEYLKMNTYDAGLDNSQGTGMCMTYYSVAKAKYLEMSATCKYLFASNSEYANARARLTAWALANGEVFNPVEKTFTSSSAPVMSNYASENVIPMIVMISLLGIAPLGFVFIRKKFDK